MDARVVVKPAAGGWIVESPEGESPVLVMKSDAVRLARRTSKELPGRTILIVLRADLSVESAVTHGAERPPVDAFSRPPPKAGQPRGVSVQG